MNSFKNIQSLLIILLFCVVGCNETFIVDGKAYPVVQSPYEIPVFERSGAVLINLKQGIFYTERNSWELSWHLIQKMEAGPGPNDPWFPKAKIYFLKHGLNVSPATINHELFFQVMKEFGYTDIESMTKTIIYEAGAWQMIASKSSSIRSYGVFSAAEKIYYVGDNDDKFQKSLDFGSKIKQRYREMYKHKIKE